MYKHSDLYLPYGMRAAQKEYVRDYTLAHAIPVTSSAYLDEGGPAGDFPDVSYVEDPDVLDNEIYDPHTHHCDTLVEDEDDNQGWFGFGGYFWPRPLGRSLRNCITSIPGGKQCPRDVSVDALARLLVQLYSDGGSTLPDGNAFDGGAQCCITRDYATDSVVVRLTTQHTQPAKLVAKQGGYIILDAPYITTYNLPDRAQYAPPPSVGKRDIIQSPWIHQRSACAILVCILMKWHTLCWTCRHPVLLMFSGSVHAPIRLIRRVPCSTCIVVDSSLGWPIPDSLKERTPDGDMTLYAHTHVTRTFPDLVPGKIRDATIGWGAIIQRCDTQLPLRSFDPNICNGMVAYQIARATCPAVEYTNNVGAYARAGVNSIHHIGIPVMGDSNSSDSCVSVFDMYQVLEAVLFLLRVESVEKTA